MIYETIKLGNEETKATLECFILSDNDEKHRIEFKRPAMIVFPGGAYCGLAWHEREPIAREYMAAGFNSFILHYSLGEEAKFPRPLLDASLAIAYVRENAEKFNIDPDRIYILGFSAGGHLAASMGALWNKEIAKISPDMPYGLNKPNGMVLCYPAITIYEGRLDKMFHRVWGAEECPEELDILKNIDEETPPAFIWHTMNDECVPIQTSFMLADALLAKKIKVRMHIFEDGRHGLGLGNYEACGKDYKDISEWMEESIYWANHLTPNNK